MHVDPELEELLQVEAELDEYELLEARDRLAVYCGLHIPAEIERDDLPALHEKPIAARYIPAAHHQVELEHLERLESREIKRLMILAPPGSAKALALDTRIPTPHGWSTMGLLQEGDQVFDELGKPCNVTWVSPVWKDRPVFKVTTDCGDEIIADHDHEWLIRLCGKPRAPNQGKRPTRKWRPFKIKETWQLCRRRAKRPMIQRAMALELPDVALPIDPYLLGVWLGDGTSASMAVSSADEDQVWLRTELKRLGYETTNRSHAQYFGVLGVRGEFVKLGLIQDPAHNTYGRKHIPAIYMRASYAQRLALLQGLIDTDGTVCRKRGCATFCNTNLELAEQFRELVRSMGVKAGWSVSRAVLNGIDHGPVYKVSLYHAEAARMPRKRALCRDQVRTPNTYVDVVPAGRADTLCIEVDSPSHLFLCGRSMTPTHNSTYGSVMFPAWYMGRHPTHGVIQGSAVEELATRFSRRARNTVASDVHMAVFGSGVSPGSKAAGEWTTVEGGEYYATGTTSFAGRRADLVVLDDIIRGRKDADSKTVRESVWQWYIGDIRPRMKPNAVLLYICTRWHEDDPAGRILPAEAFGKSGMFRAKDGEMWCVLNLVAVVETEEERKNDPLKRALGEIIWPEWFTIDMLAQERKTQGNRNWNALYQQKPRPDEGAILKKTFWRQWPDMPPPRCEFVLSCYDTAFETKEENDYSARTTWGVFWHEELPPERDEPKPKWYSRQVSGRWCAILLERWKDKVEFPELRRLAKENFLKTQQNRILIEKKASGHSLIQELRRSNVPVHEIEVDRDKVVRAHAAAVTLEDGAIWYVDRRWAEEVIDECASFPNGEHDDLVDTVVHAINYMRQHFFLQTKDQIGQAEDEEEEDAQRQSNESRRGRLF